MAVNYSRNPEKNSRTFAGVWLDKPVYAKFRIIAKRERRSIATILRFKVQQIIKQGASGIDASA